jgi:hypothetical protein
MGTPDDSLQTGPSLPIMGAHAKGLLKKSCRNSFQAVHDSGMCEDVTHQRRPA